MDAYCVDSYTNEECIISIVRTSNGFVLDFNKYFDNKYKFRMFMQTDNNVDICQIRKMDMEIEGQNPLHTTSIIQKKNSGHWEMPLGISFGSQKIDKAHSKNVLVIDVGNEQMLILDVLICRFFGESKADKLIEDYEPNNNPINSNLFMQFMKQIEARLLSHGAELKDIGKQ